MSTIDNETALSMDELRERCRDLKTSLDETLERERVQGLQLTQAKHEQKKAELAISTLKLTNNNSEGQRNDLDKELDDHKAFVMHLAKDLGLEPGKTTMREVAELAKKKITATGHEQLSGSMISDLRKILDPSNQYASVLDAARTVMRASPAVLKSQVERMNAQAETDAERRQKDEGTIARLLAQMSGMKAAAPDTTAPVNPELETENKLLIAELSCYEEATCALAKVLFVRRERSK